MTKNASLQRQYFFLDNMTKTGGNIFLNRMNFQSKKINKSYSSFKEQWSWLVKFLVVSQVRAQCTQTVPH